MRTREDARDLVESAIGCGVVLLFPALVVFVLVLAARFAWAWGPACR